ncbi:MAG TPA: NADH-ubiquinone oxidoreductase-F iron-sulfur binding region domain-containing protein [Alphaproteobacteria bacterium]|nr:NADH-ubiquinone oxidoreductase-F iron-sulfur binding region domain-containing protein [Alphaproteobacteria bacterium]
MAHTQDQIASFYHLVGNDLQQASCRGLACFVARDQNPRRWSEALAQSDRVYCLGKCYAAPASSEENSRPRIEVHSPQAVVLARLAKGSARTLRQYQDGEGYRALIKALDSSPAEIVQAVEVSGLRGRGGAAFPTGKKWRMVLKQETQSKIVVANADEGDPGAYIDRLLLEDDPFSLIEAMTIAGYAVGSSRGYIYLRKEYPAAAASLLAALAEARGHHLLGSNILSSAFSFDIELATGQGSYVCGEETSLLNSLEGVRPEVRPRPPYPSEQGLFHQPTLINNVETLANIPWIVLHGGEAYQRMGFSNSRGTKVVSLNSLFRRPGLYEVEFGIPVRRIVEEIGGGLTAGELQGLIIGGPLAGIIPPQLLDTPLGFEELHAIGAGVGHGSCVAFDQRTSIAELVQHVFDFGAFESCGKCTPCRLGTRRIARMTCDPAQWNLSEFKDMVEALNTTSFCAMGTGLGEFAASVLR